MTTKKGDLTPRPYARLIAMIGDQLIRNEKIALTELIKNSYDADASWVQIRFINFEEENGDLKIHKDSKIEIEDDGLGMTFNIINDAWVNPASQINILKKKEGMIKLTKAELFKGKKELADLQFLK